MESRIPDPEPPKQNIKKQTQTTLTKLEWFVYNNFQAAYVKWFDFC